MESHRRLVAESEAERINGFTKAVSRCLVEIEAGKREAREPPLAPFDDDTKRRKKNSLFFFSLSLSPLTPSLVSVDERADLLAALEPQSPAVTAGGSAANTLRAVARLGAVLGCGGEGAEAAAADGAPSASSSSSPSASAAAAPSTAPSSPHQAPLRVAWAPVAGADAQAAFHAAAMASAGVAVLPGCTTAAADAATGTVVVATTPDAQRSFLSHVEAAGPLAWDEAALAAASSCRLLLVEGYLWELPGAAEAIGRAVDAARSGGALVAFTAGDAGVCERHRGSIVAALDCGMADVLFANRAEASALLGGGGAGKKEDEEENDSAALLIPADEAAALLASRVGVAIVTDGANGASICALGAKTTVPPVWGPLPPVDTNGAGDAFAAGAIYGLLRGYSVVDLGRAGARAAAAVIGRHGAAMSGDEAARVVEAVEAARAKEARSEWRRRVFGGAGAGEEISSSSSASVSSSPLMSVDEK